MKKITTVLLLAGIIGFASMQALAISSEPVYKGNPEKYLKIELTKLGFTSIAVAKDPAGKYIYSIAAKGFSAEAAVYANVLKDARTAAQKVITIICKAQLQFIKGVKNPNILLQSDELKSFSILVVTQTYKIFKFQ